MTSGGAGLHVRAFDHTIADAARIQRLYAAMRALPVPTRQPFVCPVDIALLYHLMFTRGDGGEVQALAKPDGCEYVFFADDHLVRSVPTSYWALFAATFDVSQPDLLAALMPFTGPPDAPPPEAVPFPTP